MSGNNSDEVVVSKQDAASSNDKNGRDSQSKDSGAASAAELDKVRSILFGDAYRELRDDYSELKSEIERRFDLLEKKLGNRLEKQIESVRSEAADNFDSLTATINSEGGTLSATIDALDDRVRGGQADSKGELEKLSARLEESAASQADSLAQSSEAIRKEQADIQKDLSSRLDEAVAGLANQKTDRRQLAELLETVAASLRADS